MIDKLQIQTLVAEKLQGTGYELITLKVSTQNEILVEVDKMEGVDVVLPNVDTHPQFGVALREAEEAGVKVLCLKCKVTEDGLEIAEDNEYIV